MKSQDVKRVSIEPIVRYRSLLNTAANGIVFQSRSGFSPSRDLYTDEFVEPDQYISIPFWVFSLSRPARAAGSSGRRYISIPFWVFSLSRLPGRHLHRVEHAHFNPVLGFLPLATGRTSRMPEPVIPISIPFWVFSLSRPPAEAFERVLKYISIPFWVFSLSRHSAASRRGLSPDFNPVLGFLPLATGHLLGLLARKTISIPFWVFSLSRPTSKYRSTTPSRNFNPVLGFLPLATIT